MARKRMIDPGIWQSEDFSRLSLLAKMIFIGMFSQADDDGRGKGRGIYLKSVLFPYDETLSQGEIECALNEISQHMSVAFYEVEGSEFYELLHWKKWQRVDRPQPSHIPPFDEGSTTRKRSIGEGSCQKEKKRIEGNGISMDDQNFLQALPLAGGGSYIVSKEVMEEWKDVYPGIDLLTELKRMGLWLRANPKRKKSRAGIERFIQNWLKNEEDSRKRRPTASIFLENRYTRPQWDNLVNDPLGEIKYEQE